MNLAFTRYQLAKLHSFFGLLSLQYEIKRTTFGTSLLCWHMAHYIDFIFALFSVAFV